MYFSNQIYMANHLSEAVPQQCVKLPLILPKLDIIFKNLYHFSSNDKVEDLRVPRQFNMKEESFNKMCFGLISVQPLSRVLHFAAPWTAAHQASLSITNSWSLLKLMFIELVIPSNHLILCRPLLLVPSIFPVIRVFSNESVLRIR